MESSYDNIFKNNPYYNEVATTIFDNTIELRKYEYEKIGRTIEKKMKSYVRVDYDLEGEFKNMQSHGMPKCIDNKPGFNPSELLQESELSRLKLNAIRYNELFPTSLPMRIYTNKGDQMYLYNSPEGIACVKHSFLEAYDKSSDTCYNTNNRFELMDYEEAIDYLKDDGINLEFGSKEARDFVDSRNYTGIRGFLSRMKNKTASIASKAASFLGLDDDKDGR